MVNGYKTYSKTSFKEDKHPRVAGGTFKKRVRTEEDSVDYHHSFSKSSHPRSKDGSFIPNSASPECRAGHAKYGSSDSPSVPNGVGSGYGGYSR